MFTDREFSGQKGPDYVHARGGRVGNGHKLRPALVVGDSKQLHGHHLQLCKVQSSGVGFDLHEFRCNIASGPHDATGQLCITTDCVRLQGLVLTMPRLSEIVIGLICTVSSPQNA